MKKIIKLIPVLYITILNLQCCKKELDPEKIVLKSIEAHGGIDKWKSAKELSYVKTTILYDSLGSVEQKTIQTHKNIFGAKLTAEMKWIEDSISKIVLLKNDNISIYFNGVEQKELKLKEKYRSAITGANYVIWQPFKLLDEGLHLSYEGADVVDNKSVYTVKVIYFKEDGSPDNIWWYYFDQRTYKLLSTMVHHGDTYSYIENTKYETVTGLSLNKERKSYRVDSLRNKKFLRADYFYEILEFN
ncbi:DUF6503 family protein [uncultured Aquimarina sp.]|uniref:DUF6503 family protein n=1 Tax=uncultured Aquimarina sp. TaxID=575652 RepID=UPI00261A1006|nr:DUF6503 family protein [uncultured Aquimarina sp.]